MSYYQYNTLKASPAFTPHKLRHNNIIGSISNVVNRDVDIAKQKVKIKYLKEKLNQSHFNTTTFLDNTDNERILCQNNVLNQKCYLYEEKIKSLENDKTKLNMIIDEKSEFISQYELVLKDSKQKLVQLTQMNDILRETIEKNYHDKLAKAYNNQIVDDSNCFTLRSQNQSVNNTNANTNTYTNINNNANANTNEKKQNAIIDQRNNNNDNQSKNKDHSQFFIEELKQMKFQIRNIEKTFNEKLKEKDKEINALVIEKEKLSTNLNQIAKDNNSIRDEACNSHHRSIDFLTMKIMLKDMKNKTDIHEDIYHSNLQRLNKTIIEKNNQINALKQKPKLASYKQSSTKHLSAESKSKLTYSLNN